MDKIERYEFKHICHLPEHDKLWGWLVRQPEGTDVSRGYRYHRHQWCWWAQVGKTVSIKRHMYNPHHISRLTDRKHRNGYQSIELYQLRSMWPDFDEALERSMLYEMLSYDPQA